MNSSILNHVIFFFTEKMITKKEGVTTCYTIYVITYKYT